MDVNYPSPIMVNGFSCHNCSEVDLAKKDIDPAHPKWGPGGIDRKYDPSAPPLPGASASGGASQSNGASGSGGGTAQGGNSGQSQSQWSGLLNLVV